MRTPAPTRLPSPPNGGASFLSAIGDVSPRPTLAPQLNGARALPGIRLPGMPLSSPSRIGGFFAVASGPARAAPPAALPWLAAAPTPPPAATLVMPDNAAVGPVGGHTGYLNQPYTAPSLGATGWSSTVRGHEGRGFRT